MDAHRQPGTTSLHMPAHTRWSISYKGYVLGLITPDGACTASFRLPANYSITPYQGHVDGPGWLTLKFGPDTAMALSALGLSIGTVGFNRSVRVSSRFPRWVEITRLSTMETTSPADRAGVSPSGESPQLPRDTDHRCDPRRPWGHFDDRTQTGAYSLDTRC